MSGRGGGRGGGRGRGRGKKFGDGAQRTGPILNPMECFPYNSSCEDTVELGDQEQRLIMFSRMYSRHCTESEFFISTHPTQKVLETIEDRTQPNCDDPEIKKDLLVNQIGGEYFPEELLLQNYVPQRRRLSYMRKNKTGTSSAAGEKKGGDDNEDEEGGTEEEDFGGDDYAHDYYGDEDNEDYGDDGDGGGGDD